MLSTIGIVIATLALTSDSPVELRSPSEAFYEFAKRPVIENSPVKNDQPLSTERDGLKLGLLGDKIVIENKIGLGLQGEAIELWIRKIPAAAFAQYNLFEFEVMSRVVPKENGGEGLSVSAAVEEAMEVVSKKIRPKTLAQARGQMGLTSSYSDSLTRQAQEALQKQDSDQWVLPRTGPWYSWQIGPRGFARGVNGIGDYPYDLNMTHYSEKYPASFPRIDGNGFIE